MGTGLRRLASGGLPAPTSAWKPRPFQQTRPRAPAHGPGVRGIHRELSGHTFVRADARRLLASQPGEGFSAPHAAPLPLTHETARRAGRTRAADAECRSAALEQPITFQARQRVRPPSLTGRPLGPAAIGAARVSKRHPDTWLGYSK